MAPALSPVDTLEFVVVVDNCVDSLSSVPGYVTLEWPRLVRHGMKEVSGEGLCCAHHGLAILATATRDGVAHTVLFDAGPEGSTVERNVPRLGIDLTSVDAIVLSHGHWDHAGGLPAAVRLAMRNERKRPLEVVVHPDMFRQRAMTLSSGAILPFKPIPDPPALAALGAEVTSTAQPHSLCEGFFWISGQIPRVTTYEQGLPGHMRRTADGAAWEPDPLIMDERFLAVHVRDKGIVVFTACSHAGVVNVLRHAHEAFRDTPLFAVTGGFHLSGANERLIPETVRDMTAFGLSVIAPGHCTGWRATQALSQALGERVVPLAVGKTFAL